MKSLILASGLIALTLLSACSRSDARHVKPIDADHDAVVLAGQAKGEVVAIGTLATVGSFEYGDSSLVTLADATIKHGPQMLHDHQITADEGQRLINAAVKAERLLLKANATCAQNGAGKCTGNRDAAEALVDQARIVIAQGCLAASDKEVLTCLHR